MKLTKKTLATCKRNEKDTYHQSIQDTHHQSVTKMKGLKLAFLWFLKLIIWKYLTHLSEITTQHKTWQFSNKIYQKAECSIELWFQGGFDSGNYEEYKHSEHNLLQHFFEFFSEIRFIFLYLYIIISLDKQISTQIHTQIHTQIPSEIHIYIPKYIHRYVHKYIRRCINR